MIAFATGRVKPRLCAGRLCAGEYNGVFRKSVQRDRLRQCHAKPITVRDAHDLIRRMDRHYKTSTRVRFGNRRGAGGFDSKRRPYISLPTQSGPDRSGRGLRLGLVLHEYAHVLQCVRQNVTNHGAAFVNVFDELLCLFGGEFQPLQPRLFDEG